MEEFHQMVAGHAEGFRRRVQIETMTGFVLDFGDEDGLATQRRRTRDPVAFGLHPDDLRVRVLGDLADQRLAVGLRHPVARLHLFFRVQQLLKPLFTHPPILTNDRSLGKPKVLSRGFHGAKH